MLDNPARSITEGVDSMRPLTKIDAQAFSGGCITSKDKALLPLGAFSWLQNIRNTDPGFEQRKGQRKLHSSADSTNKVLSLYQYRKALVSEKHFYAQMSDGDILEATSAPPTVTTGAFGSEVFDGAASGQIPASWSILDDMLLFSNGVDQHKIYPGSAYPIDAFIVFKGSAAIPDIPQGGEDYTIDVMEDDGVSDAVLDALDTYNNFDCIFIRTPIPATSFIFKLSTENATSSTMSVYYRKNDHTYAAVSGLSDGTASGGVTLAQDGTVSWTMPTDQMPSYAFGKCGFWYQLRFSVLLSSTVRLSQAKFSAPWQSIQNVWDGVAQYAVEVQVEGTAQYFTYGAGAVDVSELVALKKVYIAFTDPIEALYIDPGATPAPTGVDLNSLKYWNGAAWVTVGTPTDGTVGLTRAGWITFPRCPAQPMQFNTSLYQAYWYEITWDADITGDTILAIQGQPYFDMRDFGESWANCVWKDRACYSFDRYGAYIYVSKKNSPMVLNGSDFGILQAGDGRANRIMAMRRYYNELMVWQEEIGVEGGCLTLFEGYSPATFGKVVLSTRIGTMNNKCVVIVDGVLTSTATDETIKTLAFFLSRYGFCVCDGKVVSVISDDINNYFDPNEPECIRYGYEREMWAEHDTVHNVIRLGLVSGASATTPNVFPVYDLKTKTWSFDTLGQPLSCVAQVEPDSGQAPIVVVGGGIADGTVYQLNYGTDDVSTAVPARINMVLTHKALVLHVKEILARIAAQPKGFMMLKAYEGENLKFTKPLSMTPVRSNDLTTRHRFTCELVGDMLQLELYNDSLGERLYAYEIGMEIEVWTGR